ncbi:macrophage receptor MARCO-like [Ascaphus truei]|uniref:macrophage receptor MARCO-like n=1 Tax=Ascaphus truei TaxID=8439 RepID=UPI003F5A4390
MNDHKLVTLCLWTLYYLGPAGPSGAIGQIGLTGPAGPRGDPGKDGAKGNTGLQGAPGLQGTKGDSVGGIVRIAGNGNRGRVEISHNGHWGTICDDNWDLKDGKVICRMLGFPRAIEVFQAGGGTGKIFLDDVGCEGHEETILECKKAAWEQHNCNHSEDAGVHCGS